MTQWWLARRLAWRLALVMLAAVALTAVAIGWRAVVTARSLEDASLQAQVAAIASGLVVSPNGTPRLDLPSDIANLPRGFGHSADTRSPSLAFRWAKSLK